jgi:hypothetical protein
MKLHWLKNSILTLCTQAGSFLFVLWIMPDLPIAAFPLWSYPLAFITAYIFFSCTDLIEQQYGI